MKEFATPDAAALCAADDGSSGPSDQLEWYYSPDQAEKVYCTTGEREDFEQYTEIALTADVIEDRGDYDALVRFLVNEYSLEDR